MSDGRRYEGAINQRRRIIICGSCTLTKILRPQNESPGATSHRRVKKWLQSFGRRSANGAKARSGKSLQSLGGSGGGGSSDCSLSRSNSLARAPPNWFAADSAQRMPRCRLITILKYRRLHQWQFNFDRAQKKNVRHANPDLGRWCFMVMAWRTRFGESMNWRSCNSPPI